MKKWNVGIIGIGRISQKYLNPIISNSKYNLLAICDLDESVKAISKKIDTLFYSDYQEMVKNKEIDLIVITTPPVTHFKIAKYCLLHGKNVILEKPAVTKLDDLDTLFKLSKENNVLFDVVFHWKYGNEILYLKDRLPNYGKIQKVETTVLDPYTNDSYNIKDEYVGLQGCWMDSGINCLSLIATFLDLRGIKLKEKQSINDKKSGFDVYSRRGYELDNIDISITVDWRYNTNHKYSSIYFEKDILYIDHSRQSIYLNNEMLVDLNNGDRLENHYKNYFELYSKEIINYDEIYDIHHIIFRDK